MREEPEIQQVYQYSVWYDIWLTVKKWAPRIMAIIIILYILRYIILRAPTWLSMTIIGFLIALPIGYIFVSRFFHVDYYVVLDVDLERRAITPYYFPVKLFLDGKWEIAGIKASFSEDVRFSGLDKDLDAINEEVTKINEDIRQLEAERREILELLDKAVERKERMKEYKKLKAHYKALLRKYEDVQEKLKEETDLLRQRELAGLLKQLDKEVDKTLQELRRFGDMPEDIEDKIIEEVTLSIVQLRRDLAEINDEIADLKYQKNRIFDQFSIISDDGLKIFVADEINWKEKKIILAPIHGYSDLELILNGKRFKEFKGQVNKMMVEYAKMKAKYDQEALDRAIELLEELDFERELVDSMIRQKQEVEQE